MPNYMIEEKPDVRIEREPDPMDHKISPSILIIVVCTMGLLFMGLNSWDRKITREMEREKVMAEVKHNLETFGIIAGYKVYAFKEVGE